MLISLVYGTGGNPLKVNKYFETSVVGTVILNNDVCMYIIARCNAVQERFLGVN
jgi:hypothetical protein